MNPIPRDGWISRQGENKMPDNEVWSETLVEKSVTYSIEVDGRFVIIEDVPARVNVETGEKYFSPETVERLQQAVWEQCQPVRTIETSVYEYAALA
ncbi:YgiT-type zinc finger protein [Candidatus Poribacteria bacterium]|nr:YgiT-type zinc finger protein [Candidatus Poribacteria bacterium]